MKRIARVGFLAAAVAAFLVVSATAASAQRPRSARDEVWRDEVRRPEGRPPAPHGEPAPGAIVLRFEHIPANSFMETLEQLADKNEQLREGLRQIPIALNEPANAVVVIAPPEVAAVMMRVAAELDHPNAFAQHMQERERGNVEFHLEVEKHKRAMDIETMERRLKMEAMKRHLAGPPHETPGEPGPQGDQPERMIRRKIQELEHHQQHLSQELQKHAQSVHRQLEEIEQHKRRLHDEFERHIHERAQEHERREHEERGHREREEMERREHEERGHREREEMQRREREEREHREREEMQRREHEERQEREPRMQGERERRDPDERPRGPRRPGQGERPGPRAPVQGRPGAGLEMLLSPRAREMLRLSDDQIGRIRDLVAETRKGLEHMMDRIREAAKDIPPQQRAERVRQMMERLKAARAERMRGIHERLMEILNPEQRQKVEQSRRGRRPPEPPHPADRPEPPERPDPPERPEPPERRDRPSRRDEEPHRPAANDQAAESRLIQDVVIIGNGTVAVDVQAAPGGVRIMQGRRSEGGPRSRMSDAEQQAMREKARARYLFRMLADTDIRAELDLSSAQEKRIVALIEKTEKQRTRIEDDVRLQFGSNDAAGPAAGDPQGHEREIRRETWQAMRDAQPTFDKLMQEAVDTLTKEQQARLEEVIRERMRLMAACGNLYLLTTAGAKEQLGLTDGQSAKIKKTLLETVARSDEYRKTLEEKHKAVQATNPDAGSDQRRQAYRAVYEGFRKFREETIKQARERVFKLLTDDQKPKAESLLAEADSRRRGTFGAGGMYNAIGIGGQSRAPDPAPAARPHTVAAIYNGGARFHLAGQDFDKPRKKAYGKDRPKMEKSPKSKSASADHKRGAVLLRRLQDPAVRAELDLSGKQEKQIYILQEKIQRLQEGIRADVREILGDRMNSAATAEDRRQIKRDAADIAKEAHRAAARDIDTILNDAAELLTPDQHAKLETINRHRADMHRATGGLAILLEPKVREKLHITDEQADRIRLILKGASKRADDLRTEVARGGPAADAKRRHEQMVRAARERIMSILSAEQREMAQRLLDRGPSKKSKQRDAPKAAPAGKGYGQPA